MIEIRNPKESQLRTRYCGINTFNVLAINPNDEKLKEMGININNFTPYYHDTNGSLRVDIWLRREEEKITTKVNFWLNQPKESAAGKYMYMDKYGISTIYLTEDELNTRDFIRNDFDNNPYTYFDKDSARKILGEEFQLTGFIKSWLGIGKGKQCRLDNIQNYFAGDFTELHNLLEAPGHDNTVLAPLGIQERGENTYYSVYSRAFCNKYGNPIAGTYGSTEGRITKIADIIKDDTYNKTWFGEYPYTWMEYVPNTLVSTDNEISNDLPWK